MKVFKNSVEGSEERLSVLQQRLEETTKLMLEVVESNWHKDQYGNGYINDVVRLEEAIEFVKVDREFYLDIEHPGHLFCVNNKFLLTPIKKKWRVKGKATWYRYGSPEKFIKKYVLEEADYQ
tara:strand:+ start:6719 stop:7084 length:366 start_codon:yes stop_codon:yes gene_type:complete